MVRSLMDDDGGLPPMAPWMDLDPNGIHGAGILGWPPGALRTDHLGAARFAGNGGHGPWVHGWVAGADQCQVGKWPWPSVD